MPQSPPDLPGNYPTVRYYVDGRMVLVHTPQEWEALPQGHADNPSGPWPEPPPWTPDNAPFAQAPPNYMPHLQGGVEFICTITPRLYAGRFIFPGQLVPRSFGATEEALLQEGAVYRARWTAESRQHAETRWWFVTKLDRDAYAVRYKTGDLSGWVPETLPEKESAAGGGRKRRGPPPAAWKSWTREEALARLVKAAEKYFEAPRSRRARRARLSWEHLCQFMNPSMHRNTLGKVKEHHRITLEDIEAELHK